MVSLLSKLASFELGLLTVTGEKIRAFVTEMVEHGEVSRDEGKKLVDDLIQRGENSRMELKSEIQKTVSNLLTHLNVPTREEVDSLKKEIARMKTDVSGTTGSESVTEKKAT